MSRRGFWIAAIAASSSIGVTTDVICAGIVDFEDLAPGATFHVGDSVITSGVEISFETFYWSSGTPTDNGHAEIWSSQSAGGTGNDIESNNINLAFDFGGDVSALTLLYGEFGGNLNLAVNGDFINFGLFPDLPASLGGVQLSVIDLDGTHGRLELDGLINSFSIGGQELWLDDIAFTAAPAPGALAMCVLALALGGAPPRRRPVA